MVVGRPLGAVVVGVVSVKGSSTRVVLLLELELELELEVRVAVRAVVRADDELLELMVARPVDQTVDLGIISFWLRLTDR